MSHVGSWVPESVTRFVSSLFLAGLMSLAATSLQGQGQAIPGHPFGVGSVSLRADSDFKRLTIDDAEDRVFFPALRTGVLPGAPERGARADRVTVSFLFKGTAPLRLAVRTPTAESVTIVPAVQPPRFYRRQLLRWWRDYNASVRQEAKRDDYPQLVHTYLAAMLGNRLGLQPPLLSRRAASDQSELQKTLELLSGAESLRNTLVREMMSPGSSSATTDQPVPPSIRWQRPVVPPLGNVGIEPIAEHVPVECCYVRFGDFPNYLWLSRLLKEYGGDIGRMVSLRGHDAQLNRRFQEQLALQESNLAEVFGPQVIADVAIVGRDLYMSEGAAMGVLFQARSSLALRTDFRGQRSAALKAATADGAVLEDIEVAGHTVSLLSTPDNRLRSFYAIDGDFHLVTTSRSIVERFYAAGRGEGALADSDEFRNARLVMPMDRGDTIFAYFSAAFFQSLVSPQYQVELRRRLQADTAIALVQLAGLAGQAEGLEDATLDELIIAGLLPAGFGRISDGSGPIVSTHATIDSLRGARRTFIPIPDVPVHSVSRREAEWYLRAASYFQQNWQQMDPLIVGVRRMEGEESGIERLVIDANISPLAEDKYGWILSLLGPPTTQEVPPTQGDIITMQATVQGGFLMPHIPHHQLFLGVKDSPLPVDPRPQGMFELLRTLKSTPGYLGAWPKLGFLDLLPFGLAKRPDLAGFSPLPLGAWRWQGDGFSVISFRRDVLDATVPELRLEPTDNPAQIRIRVGDLSQSALTGWINAQYYSRAQQASVGNVHLMQTLVQQLKVPVEDARREAEELIDGQFVCPLGGDYRIAHGDWESTAWPQPGDPASASYQAPLLNWFRGLRLDLVKSGDRLVMHCELDMHREAVKKKLDLPFLDLFK